MSSSNLRDHCASALTVLFSGNGMEPEAAKVSSCREDEQLRAELPGQPGQTLGSAWMPPSPHPHAGDTHQGRTPVSSPVFAEQREHLPLCWHLFLLLLASLVLFGSWKGASRSSPLSARPAPGCPWGRSAAGVVAEPLFLGTGVPQTSLLGCMSTPKKLERYNPKQALPGKSQLCQIWGWGHQSPLPHPVSAGRGQPCSEPLLLLLTELPRRALYQPPPGSPGALAAALHCPYYGLALQRVPSQ